VIGRHQALTAALADSASSGTLAPLLELACRWTGASAVRIEPAAAPGGIGARVRLPGLPQVAVLSGAQTSAAHDPAIQLWAVCLGERLRRAGPTPPAFWDGVPALMHATDAEGRVTAVSDRWCAALSRARGDVVGRPLADVLGEASRALAEELRPALLRTGRTESVPLEFVRADGTIIDMLMSAECQPVGDGEVRIVAALVDITEQVRMRRAIEARDADLRRLTRAASHDLQEPLRDVIGHLRRITDDYGDALDERARRSLATAVTGGARMRRSVVALRAYSRLLGKRAGRTPVALAAVLRRAVLARASDVPVLSEGPDAPADEARLPGRAGAVRLYLGALPTLLASPVQIDLLVRELVDNAFTFSADRPLRLHLDARRVGRRWRIALTDNGIGLSAELRGRALELFSRFEPARATDGAGMGLALCRRVAENHDARLALAAGAFDGGLRAVLDWPVDRIRPPEPAA